MKNILITGAHGQLGSDIQDLFSSYPQYRFFATDVDTLDISQKENIADFIGKNKIDYIVNCAAYTAVDKAEDDIELCYKINRDAVQNLAEASKGKARIIHISTDYVFDGRGNRPYIETDSTNPQSVYGESKREGEIALMEKNNESIIVRTSWLYSSYGNNFVKTMIRLGKERDQINVVSDQIGTPTYSADLAKAIMHIIEWSEKENRFESGIYHYSNDGICSWYDFTLEIHKDAGITDCKVNPIPTKDYPTRAVRPMYSVLDKTKIKETFGLVVPQWEDSLRICIEKLNERKI